MGSESEEEETHEQTRQRRSTSSRRRTKENKDESEDRRTHGPYNVDRAPTGQFVAKGSIEHPIEEYPESKTKIRRDADASDDEATQRADRSATNAKKTQD